MQVKIFSENGAMPKYMTEGSAGIDVCAIGFSYFDPDTGLLDKSDKTKVSLFAGEKVLVHTGLYMAIEQGFECQVRSRSGLALKNGIIVLNAPGTIDSDYRGECNVIIFNTDSRHFDISIGDRIAQFVFAPVLQPTFDIVTSKADLSATVRGDGGFGHSGV